MTPIVSIDLPPISGTNGHTPKRRRKHHIPLERAIGHLMILLERVGVWMTENETRLKKVYFVPEQSRFTLYAIAQSPTYDSELTQSLCVLLVELGEAGFDAFGSQIPDGTPEELSGFFNPSKALLLSRR